MGDKIRPEQMEIATVVDVTATDDNVPTTLAVWNAIDIENTLDRVTGITNYLKPHNAGDFLHLNEEESALSFATSDLQIFRNASPDISMWAANVTATIDANLNLIRSRGTIASPAPVQDNDLISNINCIAVSGITPLVFTNGAEIRAEINGAVSAGVLPCDLAFYVNAGAGVATEGMRLVKDKSLELQGIFKCDQIAELSPASGTIIGNLNISGVQLGGADVQLYASSGNIQFNANTDVEVIAGTFKVTPDTDVTLELGRSKISSPISDVAYWSHYDNDNTTDYAIKQLASGRTAVNSKTGLPLDLAINNVTQVTVTVNETSFTNEIDVGGDVTLAGNVIQLVHTNNVSNPPTAIQLNTAFGTPATVGSGFNTLLDDNNADSNVYYIMSNGTSWWYVALTKAVG